MAIRRHVEAGKPFTVAGTHSFVVGQQDEQSEAWVQAVEVALLIACPLPGARTEQAEVLTQRLK